MQKKGFEVILAEDGETALEKIKQQPDVVVRDINIKKNISEAMSPLPAFIDGNANLMEAAYRMLHENERRLLVKLAGKIIGIIREQDLFFEMEKILKS